MRPDYQHFSRTTICCNHFAKGRKNRQSRSLMPLAMVLFSAASALVLTFVFAKSAMAYSVDELTLFTLNVKLVHMDETKELETTALTVEDLIQEQNIVLLPGEIPFPYGDTIITEGMVVEILPALAITVISDSAPISLLMAQGTVKDALEKAGILYQGSDVISPAVYFPLEDKMTISHSTVTYTSELIEKEIAFKTIYKDDSTLPLGEEKLLQEGKAGMEQTLFDIKLIGGTEASRELLSTSQLPAQDKIIAKGTKKPEPIKTPPEKDLSSDKRPNKSPPQKSAIRKTIVMEATAYTHTGNNTATGTKPKVGTIAVNPKQIPYGAKLYIEGYGYGTAEDTGGFRHNGKLRVDLFMNSYRECITWGRRNVKVHVLK